MLTDYLICWKIVVCPLLFPYKSKPSDYCLFEWYAKESRSLRFVRVGALNRTQ